jgi:GNAT superfamily N-acetyltransferase
LSRFEPLRLRMSVFGVGDKAGALMAARRQDGLKIISEDATEMDERQAGVEIVRFGELELPACIDELISEAVRSGHVWASDFHAVWLARPFMGEGEALFLAWQGDRLLAMAAVSVDPFVDDAAVGRLRFIYVRQTARRRGIADGLVERCLALARGRWRRLRLHTDNPVAAQLYERYGFEPSGSDPRATHVMEIG